MKRFGMLATAAAVALLAGCSDDEGEKTASTPTIGLRGASRMLDTSSGLGCQSRSGRYPWGKMDLRTWTPSRAEELDHPNAAPGLLTGQPFTARLVQAYGEDYGEARRTVILEMADGCRRQVRAESFVDGDRALIDAEVDRRALPLDTATYPRGFRDGYSTQAMLDAGTIAVYETQHFAIWYGTRTDGNFYRYIAQDRRSMEQVLAETGEWMEKQWLINRDVLGAPMPYASPDGRRKLDIYLCGTGRPNPWDDDMNECGAVASEIMEISAWALAKGSIVPVHEFGHMVQWYTGGFRDKEDAGMIWETGAEWTAFAVSPTYNAFLDVYFNQLELGPLFAPSRYGASPIMSYFFEKDETRPLVFSTWQRNLRNANGSNLEDFFQAFVRLGRADGIYPKGWESFADDMGWYGARLAAMDFLNQRTLLDVLRQSRTRTWLAHFYTPLAPVATARDATVFAPPAQRALLQFGTHIVPLTPSGQPVKVTLTGGTTANQAAWRFTVVAVDAKGDASYAPMTAVTGKGSATLSLVPPQGSKLFLAVTATPYGYETLGWQKNGQPVYGTRFPYRVKIEGATPRTGPVQACDPDVAPGAWTQNYVLAGNREGGRPC